MLKACFAAGTPIRTLEGSQAIEKLRAGDTVLSRDEYSPDAPVEAKVIEEVFVTESLVWELRIGGQVIRTTAEHPFYRDGAWVNANELRVGDKLLCENGFRQVVEGVRDTGRWERVYNFRIADHHTYFVGATEWGFSVWAHNQCDTYANLKKLNKGTGKEVHHLIEKRFAGLFGQKKGEMLSAALPIPKHREFTNAWRKVIPYGDGTLNATRESIEAAAKAIYAKFPGILKQLGLN